MSTAVKTGENIVPAVHLEFIQNHLENGCSSLEEIESYHRSLFLHHHAIDWEKHRQDAKIHEDRLAFLEGRLKQTQLGLSEREKFVPVTIDGQEDSRPTLPWNGWDRFMFVLGLISIAVLIGFGVLNISFNLLESGFVTFRENPIRSYLWAALLPIGAFGVKIGWDVLAERRQKTIYLWCCLAAGMLGVFVWMGAYAFVYPTLSKGIDEQIAGLTVFDSASRAAAPTGLNSGGAKWVDAITVAGQAVAEIFLSAVIGMYLTSLYARHRPVRLALDPAFVQLEQERRSIEESIGRERLALGQANGNLVRLDHQLSALVAYGKSMFHREAAKRQTQAEKRQVILGELSDHIRSHLGSGEGGERMGVSTARSNLNGGAEH